MKNNDFADVMFKRHSIRLYDETVKIPHAEMLAMIDEAVSSPSSLNLQPWHFVVVDSTAGKETLRPIVRFNGQQNDTSSAMIVVCGDLRGYTRAEEIYGAAVAEGKMGAAVAARQSAMVNKEYSVAPREKIIANARLDAGLVSMQLMLVARAHGYDTNPIGGFEADKTAAALGLDPERYVPMLIIAIGVAKETGHDSVRLAAKEITEFK